MVQQCAGGKLVIASHNLSKVAEIVELLVPFGADIISAGELDLPEPIEDGDSFSANAQLKARVAAKATGVPALADDSGLVVAALGGEPGIHSARWAGPEKDFGLAMGRIKQELGRATNRRAHFACVLALAWPDNHIETFSGKVHGTLVWPPRGNLGFGYDPMFVPDGHTVTFGELEPQAKQAISHRAKAFEKLVAGCLA